MHVIKVPVVHKFGIISHCQRLQLQNRLFDEISPKKSETVQTVKNANIFEVSDEFVENYNFLMTNSSTSLEKKREWKDKAHKIFLKIKRRVGLQHNCESEVHINLALGWTELSILSQCEGDIGNDSLDLLLMSLNAAPITNRAFSVLFYLLETVLYYIQVYKFEDSSPRKHIKWLLIGEIVAVRIYLQCVLKLSESLKEKIDNLTMYIKDFRKCHTHFANYPELALPFCVIEEVTNYLLKTSEGSKSELVGTKNEENVKFHCGSFLWHAVDLCRCFSYSSFKSQIKDCIEGIRTCTVRNTVLGEWVECYLAIRVMAHAASFNEIGLEVFISIVRGLSESNQTMMKGVDSSEGEDETIICGFERGTLLLMTGMREFATIPLAARSSLVREKSLSTLAEMVLDKDFSSGLPLKIREIAVSRFEAALIICQGNEDSLSLCVIKNSIWCLLGAVKRMKILHPKESDACEKFGCILASTMYSKESHDIPQTANSRISSILIQHLLPVFLPMASESLTKEVTGKPILSHKRFSKQRPKIVIDSNKQEREEKRESCYKRQGDVKLRSILENYWNLGLPNLEESLNNP